MLNGGLAASKGSGSSLVLPLSAGFGSILLVTAGFNAVVVESALEEDAVITGLSIGA